MARMLSMSSDQDEAVRAAVLDVISSPDECEQPDLNPSSSTEDPVSSMEAAPLPFIGEQEKDKTSNGEQQQGGHEDKLKGGSLIV